MRMFAVQAARPLPLALRPHAVLAALILGGGMGQTQVAAQVPQPLPAPANAPAAPVCTAIAWPQWSDFLKHFVQDDGRVIDASTRQRMTTSEGQAYAMFFALVANDRSSFQRLWRWSVVNLAAGDIDHRLPAWSWGLRDDGSWGVLDINAASDADLWFAYALLEAGRLWHMPEYTRDGQALMAQIAARETADLPALGPMLLPAPQGFVQDGSDGTVQGTLHGTLHGTVQGTLWRLNPSYMPIPVLRRLAQAAPQGPWAQIAANTVRLIQATTPEGYAADWVAYRAMPDAPGEAPKPAGEFIPDPLHGATGSYDAIRTYLWAGMTPAGDPAALPVQTALHGLADATQATGTPPRSVQTDSGTPQGSGSFGFSAALLPYLQVRGKQALLQRQLDRVRTDWAASMSNNPAAPQPPYYDYVLSLFGTGWFEQRYRFGTAGRVSLEWEKKCP